jgi:hypothetical protein
MVEVMAEFHKKQYETLYKKLSMIYTRMELRQATYRAARRAADAGVTAIKKAVAELTTMKPNTVAERVKKYTYGSAMSDYAIGVKINDTARPISEFRFNPKMPKPNTIPVVEVYKGKGQKLNDGSFVQKMPSGHISVFRRIGKERLPIKEVMGPSVAGIFKANENIHEAVWNKIFETYEKRVIHELQWILDNRK